MAITWLTTPDPATADLAVVIVSWNVRERVLENLAALKQSRGDLRVRVVLVDNASSDGTVERVRAEHPWVRVIANPENAGFARGNLQGVLAAPARHVLLLNPDMRVEDDTCARIVSALDARPEVAVVSGLLRKGDGTVVPSVRRFPTLASQLVVLLKLGKLFPALLRTYHAEDVDLTVEQCVDSVRGSLFGMNRTALERIGFLDTRYFLWFEEVDYCRRAHAAGMRVLHLPTIQATDLVGQSFAQRPTFWKQRQFATSMTTYFSTWHPGVPAWVIRIVSALVLAPQWVIDRLWRT